MKILYEGVNGESAIHLEEKRRRSTLIRNRWWKTVTLANNPFLLELLKQRLKNERNNNSGQINQSPVSLK